VSWSAEPRPTQYLLFNLVCNTSYIAQGEICEYHIDAAKDGYCGLSRYQDGLKISRTEWIYGLDNAIDEAQRTEGQIRMRNSLIIKTITTRKDI
jgi:hypothetical protein